MGKQFDGEDRRAGEDRRDFCPMHITQVQQTASLRGMVKVLIGLVAAFGLSMLVIAGTMLWVALGMDKTFSNYIASHSSEAERWIIAIGQNLDDNEQQNKDIHLLQEGQKDNTREINAVKKRLDAIVRED